MLLLSRYFVKVIENGLYLLEVFLRSYHEIIKSKFTDRPYFPLIQFIRDILLSMLHWFAWIKETKTCFYDNVQARHLSPIFCLFKSKRLRQIISEHHAIL